MALKVSALGQPNGMSQRDVGGGFGTRGHVHKWLIHVNIWQKLPQYCKVISLQLKLINLKKSPLIENHLTR